MRLRKLLLKDAEFMLEWMHDKKINYWYCFNPEDYTYEMVQQFIEKKEDLQNLDLAIVNDEDEYLGTVSLKNIDYSKKEAEYAIVLRRNGQGKGISKFATDEILKLAFDKLGLKRVYLNVLTENGRANRFYEKYGFKFTGLVKEGIEHRGIKKDLNWYQICKEEKNEC